MDGGLERWLAEDASGSYSFSDFLSKAAVKVVHEETGTSGTSHSFSGVNFGVAVAGRRLTAMIVCVGKASGAEPAGSQPITNLVIGGVSAGADPELVYYQGGGGSTVFVAGAIRGEVVASGTTGTVSFTTPIVTTPRLILVASQGTTTTDVGAGFNASATTLAPLVDVASGGFIVGIAVKNDNNNMTWSNITERGAANVGSYRVEHGWSNRLASESGRVVGFSASGAAACAIGVLSLAVS
jgi:hypothetical protein